MIVMRNLLVKADKLIEPLRIISDKFVSPVLYLAFRLYVAWIFFGSGVNRLQSAINDDWGAQLFLFEMEHPVPGLSAELAATVTTAGEIILPVMVALGLFTRFGAAGLFTMALIIQLTYQQNHEHILWMILMMTIFIKGPGAISLDNALVRWIRKET
jgi:putative oxidoreductase